MEISQEHNGLSQEEGGWFMYLKDTIENYPNEKLLANENLTHCSYKGFLSIEIIHFMFPLTMIKFNVIVCCMEIFYILYDNNYYIIHVL